MHVTDVESDFLNQGNTTFDCWGVFHIVVVLSQESECRELPNLICRNRFPLNCPQALTLCITTCFLPTDSLCFETLPLSKTFIFLSSAVPHKPHKLCLSGLQHIVGLYTSMLTICKFFVCVCVCGCVCVCVRVCTLTLGFFTSSTYMYFLLLLQCCLYCF